MFKWHVPNKEHVVFCWINLHSSCCRRLCIPQTDFDTYMNKKLHKSCQTPRCYLWLRKFVSCRLREIWEDIFFYWFYPFSFVTLFLKYVTSPAWTLDADLNGPQSDWLWLSWCSRCLWSHIADSTCIWGCIGSVLHVFQGLQDLPLWKGHNT